MNAQDTAHDILVDLDAKGQPDLLGNPGTSPVGIALFHCNDGIDEFFLRTLRAASALVWTKTASGTFVSLTSYGTAEESKV